MHWFGHVLGLDNASGPWYLFWSGIAGDLPMLAGLAVLWRHLNCHEPVCHRIGTHRLPDGTLTCRRHRPVADPQVRRGTTRFHQHPPTPG